MSAPAVERASESETADHSAIIFVDAGVEDQDSLLSEIDSDAEVILLAGDRDGVQQISEALAGRTGISAIHILSHGNEGQVHLGNATLNGGNLGDYTDQLAGWSSALTNNADLLFYGCDLAGTPDGTQFVDSIAEITGADVAASDDLTGAEAKGGDWDLEVAIGTIETLSLEAPAWTGLLAKQVINSGGGFAADGSDGIEIHAIDNGQYQVRYKYDGNANSNFQMYEPGTNPGVGHASVRTRHQYGKCQPV